MGRLIFTSILHTLSTIFFIQQMKKINAIINHFLYPTAPIDNIFFIQCPHGKDKETKNRSFCPPYVDFYLNNTKKVLDK